MTAVEEQWEMEGERQAREVERLRGLIQRHNDECQDLCGRGDQEAVRCKYREYFEHNGRRCPECPVQWKIEL